MHTEQLKTFLSVAQTGSFSLSAKKLIVTQSTVSKRIGELEREVGQKLFVRGRTGAALTLAGNALLEYAQRIVSMAEKAVEQANRTSQFKSHLVLGTVYAYYDVYLEKQLQAFAAACPDISVAVRFGHTAQMLEKIAAAQADIVFTHHPFDHPEYLCQAVEEDDVVLVTDAANLQWQAGVRIADIKSLPMLASNFLYASTHSWIFPRDQQFQLALEVAGRVVPLLKNAKWVTLLARRMVAKELALGELTQILILDGVIPQVKYYRVMRKDSASQIAVRKWLAL